MKQSNKIWLGILTFLPFVFNMALVVFLFGFVFNIIDQLPSGESIDPELIFADWFFILGIVIVIAVVSLITTVYYIVQASNNIKLSSNLKLIWILILLLTNGLGAIVYWFLYIWQEDTY